MPDGMYESDILAWSQHQADLLRRVGRGERVNDVDWDNVVEEIESVGRSQLHAVQNLLQLAIGHLLEVHAWPNAPAVNHWRREILAFRNRAKHQFTPSMRQHIDVSSIFGDAVQELGEEYRDTAWPQENPFSLDQLLTEDVTSLLNRLSPKA